MTRDPIGRISEAMVKLGWTASAPGSWATTLTNGRVFPVWASIEDEWLRIEAELVECPDASPWDVLVAGSSIPPSVRTGLRFFAPHVASLRLVADVLAEERESWPTRIGRLSEDLVAAASRIHEASFDDVETDVPLPDSVTEAVLEAGWPCERIGEGELAVALDDGDGTGASARVSAWRDGTRLFASMRRWTDSGDDGSTDAIALFLLLTSHRLRAVSAVARREPGRPETTVGWEAILSVEPRPEDVDRTLQALAVACRHSIREVRALANPALHRIYMKQRTTGLREQSPISAAHSSR